MKINKQHDVILNTNPKKQSKGDVKKYYHIRVTNNLLTVMWGFLVNGKKSEWGRCTHTHENPKTAIREFNKKISRKLFHGYH